MKYDYQIDMNANTSLSMVLRQVTPGSRVLEFGAATGYMTQYLKETLGCTVHIVEIDPQAAAKASQYAAKTIVADIDALSWMEKLQGLKFDHILFADVLEHLRNPLAALTQAAAMLTSNGSVIASVPNIAHNAIIMELLQNRFEYQPTGLLDDTHIHFFTGESLRNMLQQAGLTPVVWQTIEVEPQNTEFQRNYANAPESLLHTLKERANGHTYQYIVTALRSEYAGGHLEEKNVPVFIVDDELQVFWWKDDRFYEAPSATFALAADGKAAKIELPFPAGIDGVRIDPGNRPAFIRIMELGVYDTATGEFENLISNIVPLREIVVLNSCFASQTQCEMLACGSDPHFLLKTSKLQDRQYILKMSLCLEHHYSTSACQDFANTFNTLFQQTNELRYDLQKAENSLADTTGQLRYTQETLQNVVNSRGWKTILLYRKIKRWMKSLLGMGEAR